MSSRVKEKQANRVVREQLAAERRRRRTILVSIIAVAAVVIAGLVGWGIYQTQKPNNVAVPAGATSDGHGIAVSSGPIRVDLYLDYLCPVCKEYETAAQPTLDQLTAAKKINLVFHPIAILDERTSPTGYSSRAGSAAGCAADGGKFLEYSKALYAQQPAEGSAGLTDDQLVQIGAGLGLIDPKFAQCVRAQTYGPWVTANTDAATSAGVHGTPTVMVAGKQIASTVDALNAAIAAGSK